MEHFFSVNGKIFLFINKLIDLMLLDIIFLITCLPIITIGTSFTALYQTTMRIVDNTESYIIRNYFFYWKQNLKRGTLLWIPSLFLLTLCILNLCVLPVMPPGLYRTFSLCVQFVLLFLLCGILLYAFSLPEEYRCSLVYTMRNASFMAFKYLPTTCLCICISASPFALILLAPKIAGWILSLTIVIGCSGIAYLHSVILYKTLKKETQKGKATLLLSQCRRSNR